MLYRAVAAGADVGPAPSRNGRAAAAPRRRYSWPELMRRVFAIDVLECPDCGHALRILAAIHPPKATRAILECLMLPTRPPPLTPARVPRDDPEFDYDPC